MLMQALPSPITITPAQIMQTGLGFWSSKILLTAVNLELFTLLAQECKSAEAIRESLDLHPRAVHDFLDTLVALRFLCKHGKGESAVYANTLETEVYLDKNKDSYIGGMLEMADNRLYRFWDNLEEGLRTGLPQNESRNSTESPFAALYADEDRLKEFLKAMGGVQIGNFSAFAKQFDFENYYTHCDIGGAAADLSIQIAINNPGILSTSFDLPQVAPIAASNIKNAGVSERVRTRSGNFFTDDFPRADLITMGNILHDWNLEEKKMLIAKAFAALPDGGALVVIENIIDDARKENAFGLMMSLNMLIETPGGFDYTAADFVGWAREAGFSRIRKMHLTGPSSAMIAYK